MHESVVRRHGRHLVASLLIGALLPAAAMAQSQPGAAPGAWKYSAAIHGYLPSISGATAFPVDSGSGASVDVTAEQILDRLKMTFMAAFEAHNGTWGVGTDILYVDLGNAKSNSRDFSFGNVGIPAGTTANLDWDYKATVWTIAGEYRLTADPSLTLDLLFGARLFDQRQRLRWSITGDLGSLPPSSRSGMSEVSQSVWDGIVGLKGRYAFGARKEWALPFYLDAGTGQSDSTVQVAAGIGYQFRWGELNAVWRYMSYNAKAGKPVTEMTFSGPQIGAVFRW